MTKNSNILKNLCDKKKYSNEQIMNNLKNCMKGKKACIFSCGYNLNEHQDNFYKLQNNDNILICCVKSSVTYLNYNCDILLLTDSLNGNYLNNNYYNNMLIVSNEQFLKFNNLNISYDINIDNFKINDIQIKIFWFVNFLIYIGINEIYLFGFYLSDYIIHDLYNYDYYKDILVKNFHTYDKEYSRIKEPGLFLEHINSSYLYDYLLSKNCNIYNVSEMGALSNKIKRIDFNSVLKEKKNFIKSKISYVDLLDEINNKLDINFYYDRYCEKNINDSPDVKKNKCIIDLIYIGIYTNNKLNINDPKRDLHIKKNTFIYEILSMYAYLKNYKYKDPNNITPLYFFAHYLVDFNNNFKVEFYKDFKIINNSLFYDSLKIKYHYKILKKKKLNSLLKNKFNHMRFTSNPYYELFIYIIYSSKIPKNFNLYLYKYLNDDLIKLSDSELILHYINTGIKEKRNYILKNIPYDFNYKIYKFLNNDLINLNKYQLLCHYENVGIRERRKYKCENIPKNFDYVKYKELNPDLQKLDRLQLILHYENYGFKEKRKYK